MYNISTFFPSMANDCPAERDCSVAAIANGENNIAKILNTNMLTRVIGFTIAITHHLNYYMVINTFKGLLSGIKSWTFAAPSNASTQTELLVCAAKRLCR